MKKNTTYLGRLINRLNDNQTSMLEIGLIGVFIVAISFLFIWVANSIR